MPPECSFEYGALRDDEVGQLALASSLAFHGTVERAESGIRAAGLEACRAIRMGGRLVGGLKIHRMGQWFGGRNVPMAGVASVAVLPEHRGQGAASAMLDKLLREMRGEGYCISTLFPSTDSLYRAMGYERAGESIDYELAAAEIHFRERDLEMAPATEDDAERIKEARAEQARSGAGNLDRNDYIWNWLLKPDDDRHGYLIQRGDRVEGYVIFERQDWGKPMRAEDWCVLSPEAGRRLLTFFADHRATADSWQWIGGPQDILGQLLPEQSCKIIKTQDWMLRLIDVAKALEARGYPRGLELEAHLEVGDERLAWNDGRFVLRIADGAGEVASGGEGRVKLDVRALAALYTGHLGPAALRGAGRIEGPEPDLDALGAIFSGPRPWIQIRY